MQNERMPEKTAVSRHPYVVMAQATTGAMIAPPAKPIEVTDMARARLRMNQWASAVLMVRKLARLVPTAMTVRAAKRCQSSCICPSRMSPMPNRSVPARMSGRGPKRSISQPWMGPSSPVSMRSSPNAHETAPRLHPNVASNWTT